MDPRRYSDKVVLVTGASSGIGAATAAAFAAEGARVALAAPASEEPALRASAERARSGGGACAVVPADVTRDAEVAAMVAEVLRLWGRIDVLVNNAGIAYHGPFETMPLDDFEKVLQVNLLGAVRCLHAVLPVMIRQGGGQVVNVASAHGRRSHPRYAAYSASKFAICGLSDTLRVELVAQHIDVVTYCPPLTESNFFANALHTEGRMKPGRPGAPPEAVARGIVEAARRRRREVIASPRDRVLIWANQFMPALVDALIAGRYEAKLRKGL